MSPDAHRDAPGLVRCNDSGDMAGRQRSSRRLPCRPISRGASPGAFGRCSAACGRSPGSDGHGPEARKQSIWVDHCVADAVYAYRRLLAVQQFNRLEESRSEPPQRGSVRRAKRPTDFALANMFTSAAAVLTFIFSRMRPRCFLIVFSAVPSSCAICLVISPIVSRSST